MQSIEAQIRKYRRNMVICGQGLILLGLWSVIKVISFLLLGGDIFESYITIDASDPDYDLLWSLSLIIFFILFLIIFLFHLRAGLASIKFGKNKTKKRKFIFTAGVIGIFTAINIPLYFVPGAEISDTTIATAIVDITLFLTIVDMFYSSYKIRVLTAKQE